MSSLVSKRFLAMPRRAPLLVFVPGIFNSLEDAFPLNGLANYSSRGYHVVVTPNLDRNAGIYKSKCSSELPYAAYDLLSASRVSDLAAETRECGEALLAYEGFQKRLVRTANALMKQGLVPAALSHEYTPERLPASSRAFKADR